MVPLFLFLTAKVTARTFSDVPIYKDYFQGVYIKFSFFFGMRNSGHLFCVTIFIFIIVFLFLLFTFILCFLFLYLGYYLLSEHLVDFVSFVLNLLKRMFLEPCALLFY